MAISVTKKGERGPEPLRTDKIKSALERAAQDAGLAEHQSAPIVGEVYYETLGFIKKHAEIESSAIRGRILELLNERDEGSAIYRAWIEHERKFK